MSIIAIKVGDMAVGLGAVMAVLGLGLIVGALALADLHLTAAARRVHLPHLAPAPRLTVLPERLALKGAAPPRSGSRGDPGGRFAGPSAQVGGVQHRSWAGEAGPSPALTRSRRPRQR